MRLIGLLVSAAVLAAHVRADVIIDWNNAMIDTVRATGGSPCPISRAFAMMHVAMFDAVNSIERTHFPYYMEVDAEPGASPVAAAAGAAHRICVHLFPERAEIYDALLDESLAQAPSLRARMRGLAVGIRAAEGIIALRSGDGASSNEAYEFGGKPGDYQTPENTDLPPFDPAWGKCKPWTMNRGTQFRPPDPPALDSAAYAEALAEVQALGRRNSAVRTAEQTEIAWFWANDRDGTFKPLGQFNHMTQVVAEQTGNTLFENARLFALVNLALAEAGIVAWDAKYQMSTNLWRPITGIRRAAEDGNPATVADPNWLPLADVTPPFPAYISGHSTFAAAHAAVMQAFYGVDEMTFTIGTDEPLVKDVRRTYTSFSQAALENGRSRVYLGVHWSFDAAEGYAAGTAVGQYVANTFLQPMPGADLAPPALCGLGLPLALPGTLLGLVGMRRARRCGAGRVGVAPDTSLWRRTRRCGAGQWPARAARKESRTAG